MARKLLDEKQGEADLAVERHGLATIQKRVERPWRDDEQSRQALVSYFVTVEKHLRQLDSA